MTSVDLCHGESRTEAAGLEGLNSNYSVLLAYNLLYKATVWSNFTVSFVKHGRVPETHLERHQMNPINCVKDFDRSNKRQHMRLVQ